MKVIYEPDNNIPIKMWTSDVEKGALEQLNNLSNLPFAYKHIAVMPDCHTGYGMPIGGVLATEGVVVPNAVGVDIGCGMCAVKTGLSVNMLKTETLKKIMDKIREVIPVGFEHHKEKQDMRLMPSFGVEKHTNIEFYCRHLIIGKEYDSALKQLGTLGSGNHFIEIQKDTENNIWIMIHSGSRNLGYKVAKHYNEIAIELNKKWFSQVPKKWELAFLPIETQEAKDYMLEMQYCVDFALANRKLMMERIINIFHEIFDINNCPDENDAFVVEEIINIAHNYARWENHCGKNVIIHRKGATSARKDEVGIIPGSQGTKSYIVKGLGNIDSFMSCSHGAGRKMGRKEACKKLDLTEEIKKLDEQGIIHGLRNIDNLDESTGAYKDISEVMENQRDLVEIIIELSPLAVIKGD